MIHLYKFYLNTLVFLARVHSPSPLFFVCVRDCICADLLWISFALLSFAMEQKNMGYPHTQQPYPPQPYPNQPPSYSQVQPPAPTIIHGELNQKIRKQKPENAHPKSVKFWVCMCVWCWFCFCCDFQQILERNIQTFS